MRFPVYSLIAPLLTSALMWAITGSSFALLFALMGPVLALAQFLDQRRQARRVAREAAAQAEQSEREASEERVRIEVARFPPASAWARGDELIRPPWLSRAPARGSGLALGAPARSGDLPVRLGVDIATGLPVCRNILDGLVLVGPKPVVHSVHRAVTAWQVWMYHPQHLRLLDHIPPEWASLAARLGVVPSSLARLVVTDSAETIPAGMRYLLVMQTQGTGTLHDLVEPGIASPLELNVDLLTRAECELILRRCDSEHTTGALGVTPGGPDARLDLDPVADWRSARRCLEISFEPERTDLESLDLVAHGPHAVVLGTTGSGKTEFLVSALVSLAHHYPPAELSLLLIDFKGGSGFARLEDLPQVAGVLSDLNPELTHRAVTSLAAELRHREAVLRAHSVTNLSDLPGSVPLARLLVVVDEYRALLDAFPEFRSSFADLASRGRSLGIHLMVATQHLSGAVSDQVLANSALRICFRVRDSAQEQLLLGADARPSDPREVGVALIRGDGTPTIALRLPLVTAEQLEIASARAREWQLHNPQALPRSPWLPPLPAAIPLERLPRHGDSGIPWGISDIPAEQRQPTASYLPEAHGHVFVVGAPRSGATNLLRTLEHSGHTCGRAMHYVERPCEVWDIVTSSHVARETGILLIDGLDSTLARLSSEQRDEFLLGLSTLLREGPQHGSYVVLSGGAASLLPASVRALIHTELPLGPTPGRTIWEGHPTQVALVSVSNRDTGAQNSTPRGAMVWEPGHRYVVVTTRARMVGAALRRELGTRVILLAEGDPTSLLDKPTPGEAIDEVWVGEPDEWIRHMTLLASLRHTATVIYDGCAGADVRALRLHRLTLPLVEAGQSVLVSPDGLIQRVRLEMPVGGR
jgi:S-DNA-T family DNA segregation ATPase FtsK/SpoIIIE